MTDPLEQYCSSFSAPDSYLNFATYGPPSSSVVSEASRLYGMAQAGTDVGDLHASDAQAISAVQRLTGFGPEGIGLVPSTSSGLFQFAFGLQAGTVLVSSGEFPSNLYPWWRAQEAGLLRVRTLGDGTPGAEPMTVDRVAALLTDDVVAVSVSAVDFRTGFRADLAGIREVIGDRLLFVDGIQGFGVIDAPWSVADAMVVGGQKWVRAGWGTGFVALSPRALERLHPLLSGWTGVEEPAVYDGVEHPRAADARMLSMTNGSPVAAGALASALELIESVGVATIEQRIAERVDILLDALDEAGVEVTSSRERSKRAGIAVARIVGDGLAQAAHARLKAAGFTTTLHAPDRIRISVHATTPPAALTEAVTILKESH